MIENKIKKFFYIIIFGFTVFSCDKKSEENLTETVFCKFDNGISYTVNYPKIIYKDSVNYLEINNYKSNFDTIDFNRIPMVYLMIEDDIITENIFKLKENNKVAFAEYFIDGNSEFEIPQNVLDKKSGNKKITVAIMDIHIKENLEEIDINNDDENVRMGYIEARSTFEVKIR